MGKIHKKKLSMTSSSAPAAPGSVHYRCEVCEVVCTGKDNLEAHLQGAKHKKVGSGEKGKGRCMFGVFREGREGTHRHFELWEGGVWSNECSMEYWQYLCSLVNQTPPVCQPFICDVTHGRV